MQTVTQMTCPTTKWSGQTAHLIVPYTLDANDMRFATAQGFNSGTQFDYLKDAFDYLYEEGKHTPKCCL